MAEQHASHSGMVKRHAGFDRFLHWVFAASILFLMGTSFLPIMGIQFEWVTLHWAAGLVLLVTLFLHIWRAWMKVRLRTIWVGVTEVRLMLDSLAGKNARPGKYSPAQKLMHLGVSVLVLATLVTGLVMMVKVDTPFWERNLYLVSDGIWGVIYVVHGLAALTLITTIMLHVYFVIRPEKRLYLRSIFFGKISSDEHRLHHDSEKWAGD
ncbi:MAG: cytochrome b/b6 domain-containing protein [Pseudomonadota bacterium]|nr:cytochrome b/b6 domain-containing protein [Pseudomonadota bacterium]